MQELLDQRLGERRIRGAVRELRHAPRVRQVEPLVELRAAAQIGADEVPRQPEQAHAALRVGTRGLEVRLDVAADRRVEVGLRRRGHEGPAADQLQQLVRARQPLRHLAAQRHQRPVMRVPDAVVVEVRVGLGGDERRARQLRHVPAETAVAATGLDADNDAQRACRAVDVGRKGREGYRTLDDAADEGDLLGLIAGLKPGKNKLVVSARGSSATLALTNYPVTGPIFAGRKETPFFCETTAFKMADGSTLPATTPPDYATTVTGC